MVSFDLRALHAELESERVNRGLSTRALAAAIGVAASTIQRIERGLSWSEVGDALDVPAAQLVRLERGGRTTIGMLAAVAAWLGVPIAALTRECDQ